MPEVRRGITCPAIPPLHSPCSAFSSFLGFFCFFDSPPPYPCCLAEGAGCFFFFCRCVITTSGESQTDASPPPLLRVSHHTQPAAAFIIRAQIMANRSPCCNCSHDHNPGGRGEGLATHILLCVLRRFDLADTSQGRPFDYVTKTGLVLVFSSQTKFLFLKKKWFKTV